jgi:predicted aspartyl protease
MKGATRFPFEDVNPAHPGTSLMPLLPIVLSSGGRNIQATGLLDTGATVSVLPYSLGEQLGFVWDEENNPMVLTGNLSRSSARAIIVSVTVAQFAPVRLGFAWIQSDDVRLLLGQMNFFSEFDACFFQSRMEFEVKRKSNK